MAILTAVFWLLSVGLIGGLDAGAMFTVWHGLTFCVTLALSVYWLQR